MAETQPERPAEGWKYPYVAGAVDFTQSIRVDVSKASDRKVGYEIVPSIRITKNDSTVFGFLDEYCQEHRLNAHFRGLENSFRVELYKREDVSKFLDLIRPYLIVKFDQADVLVEDLIPGLEAGKGSTEEGFVELMGYVDEIREATGTVRGEIKYDQDHFRELWGV